MALTGAFLTTCRAAVSALPELTAFRAALALAEHTRAGRVAAWNRAFSATTASPSPANCLAKAIRDTINAQADASGALGPLDRETAYRTLAAEFVPTIERPASDAAEAAALETLLRQEQLS